MRTQMEIEYKWDLAEDELERRVAESSRVSGNTATREIIEMHAIYYDSVDNQVGKLHGGLRVRRENDESVCCLKLSAEGEGGYRVRREYEVDADCIETGLRLLPQAGAPADLCTELLSKELQVLCETEFTREALTIEVAGAESEAFVAELAIDSGMMRRQGREAPIHELELEYKSGSLDAFHAYAKRLEVDFGLKVQPLAKLARAMAL